MGQPRTAILLGTKRSQALLNFMEADEHGRLWDQNPGLRVSEDGQYIGFPVAVAHDPPAGCAELLMPVVLNQVGQMEGFVAALAEAQVKWGTLRAILRASGIRVGKLCLYLAEVERA